MSLIRASRRPCGLIPAISDDSHAVLFGILAVFTHHNTRIGVIVARLPQQPLATPSPLYATISGRLGKEPESNRASAPDWYSASLCYDSPEDRSKASSWLRIQCRTYFSIADRFIGLETGALISATGPLESWQTAEGKHRCALSLRGFDRSGARSYAAQSAPSQSLVTAAAPADAGLAPAELLDEQPADDAFVGAGA
jgi:hypothetical protein